MSVVVTVECVTFTELTLTPVNLLLSRMDDGGGHERMRETYKLIENSSLDIRSIWTSDRRNRRGSLVGNR